MKDIVNKKKSFIEIFLAPNLIANPKSFMIFHVHRQEIKHMYM